MGPTLCRTSLPVVLALTLAGCTHTHVVQVGAPPVEWADASERFAGKDAEVLTRAGQVFRWYDVRVDGDSVSGVPAATGAFAAPPAIPTPLVVHVQHRSRWRGVLDGALIAAGIGGAIGLISDPDSCEEFCGDNRFEQALIVAGGASFWGILIGAIVGSRTRLLIR